jgi:CHAT domain-containing protein
MKSMMLPFFRKTVNTATWSKAKTSYRKILAKGWRANGHAKFRKQLEIMGQEIWDDLLNDIFEAFDIKKFLDKNSYPDLALLLDQETGMIPWELAFITANSQFVCEKANIGRVIDVKADVGIEVKRRRRKHQALIIGTTKTKYSKLDAQNVEKALECFKNKNRKLRLKIENLRKPQITSSKLKSRILDRPTILHFSGHGNVEGRFSEIHLEKEIISTIQVLDIFSIEGTMAPIFSFFNACRTATCETLLPKFAKGEVFNWPRTMADHGGRACIGTLWDVDDYDAALFSKEFYRNFFNGGEKLGESVRLARQKLNERTDARTIFTWPAYVVYGPPTVKARDVFY